MPTGFKAGGRAVGTPNKATAEVRALASQHGPAAIIELTRLAGLQLGEDGKPEGAAQTDQARISALGMLLDRGYGRSQASMPVQIDLPDTAKPEGTVNAMSVVVASVAAGEISPAQAKELADVIEIQRKVIETQDLAERIARLEAATKGQ